MRNPHTISLCAPEQHMLWDPSRGLRVLLGQCNIMFFVISVLFLLVQRRILVTHTSIMKIEGLKWGVGWRSSQISCLALCPNYFFFFSWLGAELDGIEVGEVREMQMCREAVYLSQSGAVDPLLTDGIRLHVDYSVSHMDLSVYNFIKFFFSNFTVWSFIFRYLTSKIYF